MNITECFPMRKRRSIDKTPGRSHDAAALPCSPVGRLRRTPCHLAGTSSCNNSFTDQSLEIVWDNNSPSPARTLSLGKRKKHYGSDSSSSGGEISDLVQKLADKTGHTPDANPPLLALWMSRESITTVQRNNDTCTAVAKGSHVSKQKAKEFQTPSRRPRRVLRKCNKSKMKLLKQDIELLCHPIEKTVEESPAEKNTIQESRTTEQQKQSSGKVGDVFTSLKQNSISGNSNSFATTGDTKLFDAWESDEDDLILSQMEIPVFKNNIPETQVMTNTQSLDSGKDTLQKHTTQKLILSKDHSGTTDENTNDSIVTESWDFIDELGDSDDEDMLETALEDFEKSQQMPVPTVRRMSDLHVTPKLFHKEINECDNLLSKDNSLRQTRSAVQRSGDNSSGFQRNSVTIEKCSQKASYSFVPRSTLQSTVTARSEPFTTQQAKQHDLKSVSSVISSNAVLQTERQMSQNVGEKQQQSTGQRMVQKGTFTAKPARYSKEDIQRKKLEAQNRRRQKLAQSQQKKQN